MARPTRSATPSPDEGFVQTSGPGEPAGVALPADEFGSAALGPQAAPAIATPPPRPPDAVLYHESMKRGNRSVDRAAHVQRTFGPVLGGNRHTSLGAAHGGRVYSRDVGGGFYLATLDPSDSLLFGKDHDLAGQDRYRWEERGEGVKFGWLVDEDEASPEDALPDVTAARKAQREEWRRREEANPEKVARLRELRQKLRSGASGFTNDDAVEMDRLTGEIYGE